MPADEIQHDTVKDVRPLPINGVASFRHHHELTVGNVSRKHSRHCRRLPQIGVACDQQRRHRHLFEAGEGDFVGRSLYAIAGDSNVLKRKPLSSALRVRGAALEVHNSLLNVVLYELGGRWLGIVLREHTDEDGALIFQQACKMGLEGIVSKRSGPSRDWIKVKNPDSPAMIRAREAEW
jgi:hypothetical protein